MKHHKREVLPGRLNLMALKTLETLGPWHGYGIARRIEQTSGHLLQLNQGAIYPALLYLERRGWNRFPWGGVGNKQRAHYYSLTRARREQNVGANANWERAEP